MCKKPLYNTWQLILMGGFCSAAICSISFSGSFIDCFVSFPLGALLVAVQLFSVRNELYSNVFECVPWCARSLALTGRSSQNHHRNSAELPCCGARFDA